MADNAVPECVRLTYFFWLPAGKDEFGSHQDVETPFAGTTFFRTELERTIADHFADRAERLREANRLAYMSPAGVIRATDGELGLRKIHFRFSYQVNNPPLEEVLGTDQLDGTAVLFSSGLYLWSFDIPARAVRERPDLKDVLTGFLVDDFVERHVRRVFDFGWNPGSGELYRGVLNYFQLDLLVNGIFDQGAHPHLFLDGRLADEERIRANYDIRHLVQAFSLCAFERDYFPLYDHRKNYSLRRDYGDPVAYIDSSVSIEDPLVDPADVDLVHRRELFFSRLTFAAMEQFLRVAGSFGLTLYRLGLDYVRAQLTSQSIEARQNRASGELRRPSLAAAEATLGDLEAYQALLAGKMPRVRYLRDLTTGLAESARPVREVKANGVEGAVEWHDAYSTLAEARAQFHRQVEAIDSDLRAIEASLLGVRSELTLAELTEARKLAEIEAEAPRSAVLRGAQWDRLTARLAVFAAIIGGAQLFSEIATWLTERTFDGGVAGGGSGWLQLGIAAMWGAGVVGFVALLVYYGRRRTWSPGDTDDGADRPETHVFDYASLLKQVRATGGTAAVLGGLRERMYDPEDLERLLPCVGYSTFREMPSSGVERIKHSLETVSSPDGLSYILDVEVDRRLGGGERLVGVRLVIRRPGGGEPGRPAARGDAHHRHLHPAAHLPGRERGRDAAVLPQQVRLGLAAQPGRRGPTGLNRRASIRRPREAPAWARARVLGPFPPGGRGGTLMRCGDSGVTEARAWWSTWA